MEDLIYGHWGITGVIALILAVAALLFWQFDSNDMAQGLIGLAVASPLILLLWLVRRAFYVQLKPHWSATGGALYLLVMLAGIYGLYQKHWLSVVGSFLVMGLASLVVGVWLSTLLRPQWGFAGSNPTPSMVLADHWKYGRWSTATTALMWIPGNIYYMLLPLWVGGRCYFTSGDESRYAHSSHKLSNISPVVARVCQSS